MVLNPFPPNLVSFKELAFPTVKYIHKILLSAALLYGSQALAQSTSKPVLDSAPVPAAAQAPAVQQPEVQQAQAPKPAWSGPRLQYGFGAGASFSSGFGSATYVEPSARYQVSNRFRVNVGMTYLNVLPYQSTSSTPEGSTVVYRHSGGSHYIVSAGVDYLASNRLILSGNIWRDFTSLPTGSLHHRLYSPGKLGADFRATYKITDNFSVTGGIRYTDGVSPFYSPFYQPGFGSGSLNGFGY